MLDLRFPLHHHHQHHHGDEELKKTNKPLTQEIVKAPINAPDSEGEGLALFRRDEIKTGALVGSGSFSEVFEIASFREKKRRNSKTATASASAQEPTRRRKREELLEAHEQNMKDLCSGKVLKSRYVIKQLHQKLLEDPKLFRRALKDLATEVSIMSSVDHPHIVSLHATAIGGAGVMMETAKHDSYFLVMDRLVETLDDRIVRWNEEKIQVGSSYYLDHATNRAKMALKANYALQIASALKYLHERRIIFRDLKPQNIGFKEVDLEHPERDVLALFDFGLSRKLPSPEKADSEGLYRMSMVGTRRYMAPEVVISRQYDTRADVYSWSLLFYELVTQTRPYDGIQRNEHKQHICVQGKRPKIYSYYGFPPELEHMLRLGWAQDISKRLSMKEICATLQDYLQGTIHEDCVLTSNKPSEIHDGSISSLISYSTQQTEQTISTANSLTFDMDDDVKPDDHETSETGAAVGPETIPRAIEVTTSMPSSPQNPDGESPPTRRVTRCERCMSICRRGLKRLHFFH